MGSHTIDPKAWSLSAALLGWFRALIVALIVLCPCISVATTCGEEDKSVEDVTRSSPVHPAPAPEPAVQRPPTTRVGPDTSAGAPTVGKGDLYALVVGIARYREPKLRLQVSDNDARVFAEFLRTQKKLFRNVHVTLMVNERATKVEVEKHLNYELLRAGKDDTVMIYLSGHGSGDRMKPGEYYFLTHDSDPRYPEATAVKLTGLQFLNRISAPRVLLIADACHSGGASNGDLKSADESCENLKSADESLEKLTQQFNGSRGRVIMTSSKPDEYSREKPSLNHSVFTYYVLKGLRGEADTGGKGLITLHELYDYVYARTKDETKGGQHPLLKGEVDGPFPVAITGDAKNPIQLEVNVVAQDPMCRNRLCTDPPDGVTQCPDPLCGDVPVVDGDIMYSGQNYQIAFRPSSTSYVYVYQVDQKGAIHRLFPGNDFFAQDSNPQNPVQGGRVYWIPGKHGWLRLDDSLGKEQIYVVASHTRNVMLEDLYSHLERLRQQGGNAQQAKELERELVHNCLRPMGVLTKQFSRACPPPARGMDRKIRLFEDLSRCFYSSTGLDAVKSISVDHRGR